MAKKLKDCFPMIREEKELLAEIRESETLRRTFQGWPEEKQRIFLDCCTGARGVKMLYDSFFKEIMNPERTRSGSRSCSPCYWTGRSAS